MSMRSTILLLNNHASKVKLLRCVRGLAGEAGASKSSSSSGGTTINPNVPGLSSNCLKTPTEPVGPGASKNAEYKNPEYFSYHTMSYFEAEVEMSKFRVPQPSNKK